MEKQTHQRPQLKAGIMGVLESQRYKNPEVLLEEFFFFFINKFIYLFMAALGLCCCVQASSSYGEWGLVFVAVRRLLIAVASLVAEHGL